MTTLKTQKRKRRKRQSNAKPLTWTLHLGRIVGQPLEETLLLGQARKIQGAMENNKTWGLQVGIELVDDGKQTDDGLQYVLKVVAVRRPYNDENVANRYYEAAATKATKLAARLGWRTVDLTPQGEMVVKSIAAPQVVVVKQNLEFGLPPLTPEVFETIFGRIYEREPHIRTIYKSAVTAVRTHFEKRRHVLAYGLPAGAKSEIFSAFMRWFNTDAERVLALDATTTTKAGLELLLIEKAETGDLPPFLYLEEIEKHDITSLLSLLQVMDHRGKISRTNARQGNISASAKLCIWATCNDFEKLRKYEGGALYSRFNLRLWSPRPSPDLMRKILEREATEMGANKGCIGKILKFGYDEMKTNDPREFIALLDGWEDIDEYLQDQREMLASKRRDIQEQDLYRGEALEVH